MNTKFSDPLGGGDHDRLAHALCDRQADVLAAWERAVRAGVPNADASTVAQLRSSIPAVLGHVCTALAGGRPDAMAWLAGRSRDHGATRFAQRYTAAELMAECRLLRQAAAEHVTAALDGRPTAAELASLHLAVDVVAGAAVDAYVDAQRRHLEHAAEVEGKFLAYLAHDQRNHLNHALLLLEVHTVELAEYPQLRESVSDLAQVREAILATTGGMERLMEAERLRRAAVRARREPVDVAALLSAVAAAFAATAAAKGLGVTAAPVVGPPLNSDPGLIRLALNNLVGNAVKFAAGGTVRLSAEADAGGWRVCVADDGPGISPDRIDRLFDAFARGETHGQAGMGLGLSIASAAARQLGGTLSVTSAVGAGSTFTLTVPNGPADLLSAG